MCLFVSSPDQLPRNSNCLKITIAAYFLLGLILLNEQQGFATIAFQILLEILLLGLITFAGLKLKSTLSRFQQTFAALVGVNLVISAMTLPIFNILSEGVTGEASIQNSLLYATMLVVFWNLAVLSQIFSRAFGINTFMSAMIAFNYFVVYQFAIVWLY